VEGEPRSRERRAVLVAGVDVPTRRFVAETFADAGYRVVEVPDGAALFAHLQAAVREGAGGAIDLIVSELRLPGCNALDLLESLRRFGWRIPIILLTATGEAESRPRRIGWSLVLEKPVAADVLVDYARRLMAESS
jgi:CheY-like chemotaxis protein